MPSYPFCYCSMIGHYEIGFAIYKTFVPYTLIYLYFTFLEIKKKKWINRVEGKVNIGIIEFFKVFFRFIHHSIISNDL